MIPLLLALALHTPCGTWIERLDPPTPSPIVVPMCVVRPMLPTDSCDSATLTRLLGLPPGEVSTTPELVWPPVANAPGSGLACIVRTKGRLERWNISADGGPCLVACSVGAGRETRW